MGSQLNSSQFWNNHELLGIESLIFGIRAERVFNDTELAKLYGVSTKRLNQYVRRNTIRSGENTHFNWRTLSLMA
ncbi:ORF6N domain protein [Novipirellula galeiformis]|uniref:ORF6N domain protein n=1 Tax=Novipirellula galeiformis TaxID=2528004 RepID=A0A5C6CJR9_9BACT|nr:ORF6N domain-containing protein [Novipirellula galeiformis]TWU25103.1 ORF6N domain protein [Novipirellula galeiformis]